MKIYWIITRWAKPLAIMANAGWRCGTCATSIDTQWQQRYITHLFDHPQYLQVDTKLTNQNLSLVHDGHLSAKSFDPTYL